MWSGSVLDTSSDMHPNVENGHSTGLVGEREIERERACGDLGVGA